ncbi:efflux RND transporter periplasmic adaptor subunit [Desulfosarcina sp.]|uniref:efflux RND transporter periplasmic adaptor subunit n=1 Tax=Desulfosarcina sp. TaxID=2027861 RepID=UPI003970E3E2
MKRFPLITRPRRNFLLGLLLAGALFFLGYWSSGWRTDSPPAAATAPDHGHADVLSPVSDSSQLYACAMMCTPPLAEPGRCPVCGMELMPVEGGVDGMAHTHPEGDADAVDPESARIRLSSQAMKLAEIRLAPVVRQAATADIRLFGEINYDPAHMTRLSAFMPGVIDRVYVKRAGQFVRWGDPLFDIYSTDLHDTQKQLIELLPFVPSFLAFQSGQPHVAQEVPVQDRHLDSTAAGLEQRQAAYRKIAAIRHKLSILGLPKRDIDELMKVGDATGIATVYASMYGQVVEQNAFEGSYVNRGTTIITLADPKYVWARLDAYESDYPWLRKGQEVQFETTAYPGEQFTAELVYIDPVFNPQTRTFRVGALLSEQGGRLKTGMLIRATVHARLDAAGQVAADGHAGTHVNPLLIPATAPLITGRRAVVYAAVPGQSGLFEGREVVLGPKSQDHYVVLEGLDEGEYVVANGHFKIDSAVQILARKSMMAMPDNDRAEGYHLHGGSEAMNAEYLDERNLSRMPRESQDADLTPGGHDDGDTFVRSRRPESRHGQSAVQRRRPGSYGDSTRRSTRALGQ